MRGLIAGFILCLSLCAQTPAWQVMPSHSAAPDVYYRMREEGQGLLLEIRPEDVDLSKWALRLWIGDPRMVEARQKHLKVIRTASLNTEALLKDKDHQTDDCQERLHFFLGEAREAQLHFHDYDPYEQILLSFGPLKEPPGPGLRQVWLIPVANPDGTAYYRATIPFDGGFDTTNGEVGDLSFDLTYVLRTNRTPLPLKTPQRFNLSTPWQADVFLAPDMARLQSLLQAVTASPVRLHQSDGYHPGKLGEVSESGCYGEEGRWRVPDLWFPWPDGSETRLQTNSVRFLISFLAGHGSTLFIQRSGALAPSSLSLRPYLGSAGEQGIVVEDSSDASKATFLLLSISGSSVPGGGGEMCGGGTETNLVWLNLDLTGRLRKAESFLTDSCIGSIESESGKSKDGTWTWEWDIPTKHLHHRVTYDPAHPERGLQDAVSPMAQD